MNKYRRRSSQVDRYTATRQREFKPPWREVGPLNYFDDKMDPDQWVVNKELSLTAGETLLTNPSEPNSKTVKAFLSLPVPGFNPSTPLDA